MKFSPSMKLFASIGFTFLFTVKAQEDTTTATASMMSSASMSAASALPSVPGISDCANKCITQAAVKNNCRNIADINCLCTSAQFQADANSCLSRQCSSTDLQAAMSLQSQQCGAVGLSATGSATSDSFSATGISATASGSSSGSSTTSPAGTTATGNAASKVIFGYGAVIGLVTGITGFIIGGGMIL